MAFKVIQGQWFPSHLIGCMPFRIVTSHISHHFQDMASFQLKNAHFSYPPSIQPQIWKCCPWTASPKFCTQERLDKGLIISAKFSPMTKCLATIHPLQTDGQRQMTTCSISSTVTYVWSAKNQCNSSSWKIQTLSHLITTSHGIGKSTRSAQAKCEQKYFSTLYSAKFTFDSKFHEI